MRAQEVLGKQNAFLVFAFFACVLAFIHFYAPALRPSDLSTSTIAGRKLQKNWSITGKSNSEGIPNFKKPPHLKVVGLVFYGRPASVSILDCYLKRNLVANGGMLDEVIFLARTERRRDLAWLDNLVLTSPYYRRQNLYFTHGDYRSAYNFVQNGTLYIKIDDDIVFLEDSAIPTMVSTKLDNPDLYIVSANIVNQPSLSWVHQHLGVVKPYLPELEPPVDFDKSRIFNAITYDFSSGGSWRASALPSWTGPASFRHSAFFEMHPNGAFPGHRWLPVRDQWNSDNTPIMATQYDAFGPGWWQWSVGAQQHYSFFEHLENNELWRYKFPRWDYNYQRMGIQMVAMMGDDINLGKPILDKDDEYYFSEFMPAATKRHGIVEGRALAAHYSFGPQREGMAATDILDRYRAFAIEHICM